MAEQFSSHPGHGSAKKTAQSFATGFTGTKGGGASNIHESRDNQNSMEKGSQIPYVTRPGKGTGQAVRDGNVDSRGWSDGAPNQAKGHRR